MPAVPPHISDSPSLPHTNTSSTETHLSNKQTHSIACSKSHLSRQGWWVCRDVIPDTGARVACCRLQRGAQCGRLHLQWKPAKKR